MAKNFHINPRFEKEDYDLVVEAGKRVGLTPGPFVRTIVLTLLKDAEEAKRQQNAEYTREDTTSPLRRRDGLGKGLHKVVSQDKTAKRKAGGVL